jgi:phage replication-related protein YjqB (UPF0714/DUF867 family)
MLRTGPSDKYMSFDALSRAELADAFRIVCLDRGSSVAVLAPHGGKTEVGTSDIARAIAGDDWSFYSFAGRSAAETSTSILRPPISTSLRPWRWSGVAIV